MDTELLDQELGPALHWQPVASPARAPLTGRSVDLVPLDAGAHAASLFRAAQGEGADARLWLYLPYGPFPDEVAFKDLGIDSMMGVEIVAAIERKYQVKIDDAELVEVTTLNNSMALVQKKLGKSAPVEAAVNAAE